MSDDSTTLRCIGCRYDLRGLAEHRCPECGRGFDPHDQLTMYTPQSRQRLRLASWLPALVFGSTFLALFALPSFLSYWWRDLLLPDSRRLRQLPWIFTCMLIAMWLRTRTRRSILWPIKEPAPGSERWGRRIIVAGIIFAVLYTWGMTSWTCPHGHSVQLGPFVMTTDSDYGPCSNYCDICWRMRIGKDTFFSIAE